MQIERHRQQTLVTRAARWGDVSSGPSRVAPAAGSGAAGTREPSPRFLPRGPRQTQLHVTGVCRFQPQTDVFLPRGLVRIGTEGRAGGGPVTVQLRWKQVRGPVEGAPTGAATRRLSGSLDAPGAPLCGEAAVFLTVLKAFNRAGVVVRPRAPCVRSAVSTRDA